MKIRAAAAVDIALMIELERSSSTAAHWSEQQYLDAFEPPNPGCERLALVAEAASGGTAKAEAKVENTARSSQVSTLLGFLVARHISPEWELENIVVAEQARRNGIGAALLRALLDRARQTSGKQVFLEVRDSNVAARKLYEKAGFRESGRRKMYYSDPSEDAILYSQDIV